MTRSSGQVHEPGSVRHTVWSSDPPVTLTLVAKLANFVFLTSSRFPLSSLASIAHANSLCGAAAANGGLGGDYVAWMQRPRRA